MQKPRKFVRFVGTKRLTEEIWVTLERNIKNVMANA